MSFLASWPEGSSSPPRHPDVLGNFAPRGHHGHQGHNGRRRNFITGTTSGLRETRGVHACVLVFFEIPLRVCSSKVRPSDGTSCVDTPSDLRSFLFSVFVQRFDFHVVVHIVRRVLASPRILRNHRHLSIHAWNPSAKLWGKDVLVTESMTSPRPPKFSTSTPSYEFTAFCSLWA